MGIETAPADRKGKDFCELPRVTNSNGKAARKARRRHRKMPSPVQRLFEICREVFSASASHGRIPPPEDILRLRSVLDDMKPEDVGLTPELPYFRARRGNRTQTITYLHLFECEKFSMGIFCLPPSGVIPLHNHPEMTVFSKLLFGTMHIKSYDWAADSVSGNSSTIVNPSSLDTSPDVRLAKVKVDSNFTAPCDASILYPADGGNIHCFTAVTACAVLDVLGPPYSDPDGRHCTYYYDFPFSYFSDDVATTDSEEKDIYAWLQEREILPEDLAVVGAPYRGPNIVEN